MAIEVQGSPVLAARRRRQETLAQAEDHRLFSHKEHTMRRGHGAQEFKLPMRNRDLALGVRSSDLINILHLRNVRADIEGEARREIARFLDHVRAGLERRGPGELHPSTQGDVTDEAQARLRTFAETHARETGMELGEWSHAFYNRPTFRKLWGMPRYTPRFVENGATELVTGLDH